MEFTFKPYTKVIFFSSCYIDLQFNCTLVPIYFFIFILFTLFIFDYYYNQDNENGVSSKPSLTKVPLVGGSNDSGLPRASYDAEGLFPLEDLDNLQIDGASDDDLSESDGNN